MRVVVADTGPLLHLAEAQALDLLRLTGEVHIPPSVEQEMSLLNDDWEAARPGWLHVTLLEPEHATQALVWEQAGVLDRGEAEAIGLTRQLMASWFLTDDASARLVAQSLGIEAHGSLGVVLWAAATKHLSRSDADSVLTRLSDSSLWLSEGVLAEARAALDRLA